MTSMHQPGHLYEPDQLLGSCSGGGLIAAMFALNLPLALGAMTVLPLMVLTPSRPAHPQRLPPLQ
jgi:hypothetical protein